MTKPDHPSIRVGVHEAKTRLSELLRMVEAGQEIEILRGGEPVALLVPLPRQGFRFGVAEGEFTVPEDFDDPLPDEILDSFHQ
jgi:prevent-host-death family protein